MIQNGCLIIQWYGISLYDTGRLDRLRQVYIRNRKSAYDNKMLSVIQKECLRYNSIWYRTITEITTRAWYRKNVYDKFYMIQNDCIVHKKGGIREQCTLHECRWYRESVYDTIVYDTERLHNIQHVWDTQSVRYNNNIYYKKKTQSANKTLGRITWGMNW